VIMSLGLAPLFTLAADLAIGSAPPERAGAASGISETSSELGGALGIAILGTIGTAVYRGDVADGLPAAVPAAARDGAGETLGGAVEAADRLPVNMRAELLDPAREAFTHAFAVAASVSGAIVVAAAILVATVFRRAQAPEESGERAALPGALAVEPCA
jgi:MFS transporter, DHA2 family, multidrug resistance protein